MLRLRWDEESRVYRSRFASLEELPPAIREVFEQTGYSCLAVETSLGVLHVCHAADEDTDGVRNKPALRQWQLIKMPRAPLIRLELSILDDPATRFRFESFLNVAQESKVKVLADLANQEQLYLASYDDDLRYRCTRGIEHHETSSSGNNWTSWSRRRAATGSRFLEGNGTLIEPRLSIYATPVSLNLLQYPQHAGVLQSGQDVGRGDVSSLDDGGPAGGARLGPHFRDPSMLVCISYRGGI